MTQTTNCFNDAAFNFAQRSQEEWEKKNRRLSRIKKGLIIAAAAQIAWVLAFLFSEDNVLGMLTEDTTVMHDHNTLNYNKKFKFKNIEC